MFHYLLKFVMESLAGGVLWTRCNYCFTDFSDLDQIHDSQPPLPFSAIWTLYFPDFVQWISIVPSFEEHLRILPGPLQLKGKWKEILRCTLTFAPIWNPGNREFPFSAGGRRQMHRLLERIEKGHVSQRWGSRKASWSSDESWRGKSWIDENGKLGRQLHVSMWLALSPQGLAYDLIGQSRSSISTCCMIVGRGC